LLPACLLAAAAAFSFLVNLFFGVHMGRMPRKSRWPSNAKAAFAHIEYMRETPPRVAQNANRGAATFVVRAAAKRSPRHKIRSRADVFHHTPALLAALVNARPLKSLQFSLPFRPDESRSLRFAVGRSADLFGCFAASLMAHPPPLCSPLPRSEASLPCALPRLLRRSREKRKRTIKSCPDRCR
jgi:hypothetical protein